MSNRNNMKKKKIPSIILVLVAVVLTLIGLAVFHSGNAISGFIIMVTAYVAPLTVIVIDGITNNDES